MDTARQLVVANYNTKFSLGVERRGNLSCKTLFFPLYYRPMTEDNFRKKLLYRSLHRGCKETDLLLGKFAEKHIPNMSDGELKEWNTILDQTDSDIVSWVMGRMDVPEHLQSEVMKRFLQS